MIECEEVRKSFKNNIVIKNVNLKLNNGEITSLIGRNGAGKSTLINLIVGYYHLDSGRISKNSLSVMPDADNIYSSWTGLEFLSFMSKMKKNKLSEALAMADKLGLTPKIKTKISGYSFGMKKKLSFVQCAIGDYDAYIFDEPTSGVDVPSALVMLDIVKRLKERNAAVLLTSHNIDELERVSD
ncbi:ABC transporter ATP-binding protein [Streptococcus orisratti]|uniref:ABC transporter ATP-binding protein n=1 Tax=Streptococcus orisratti TaxID=114652 RepID=UPI003D07704A